jgi:dipeptidyl aminopeptidase/acylaminoacyl peptidase
MLIRIAVAALATCLSIATARAAPRFIDPWPDARQARGVQVEDVHFTSSDAFAPEDLGHAPAREVRAMLFLPADANPAHPVPAVVLLHGSAGNAVERGERYGEPLAAMGVAVLVIETYASRPDLGSSYLTLHQPPGDYEHGLSGPTAGVDPLPAFADGAIRPA